MTGNRCPSAASRVKTLALAASLVVFSAAHVSAQEVVADFSAGPPSGKYAFPSSTPKTLGELRQGNAPANVNIIGNLFLPPGTDKVPAVVLVPGSGGIYNALLDYWPKQFNSAGMAVLTLDLFTPRGVQSTTEDQSQVPFSADVADAFAALRLLASHPRIDPRRIAIMGFSRGGIATWRSGIELLIASQKLPDGLRYAAHIPVYSGGCVGIFRLVVKPGTFSKSPMLFIHGDADDYTPMAPCQDYAKRIGDAGTPVEFVVIPGAHHKFDMDDTRRIPVRNAQRTRAECVLEVDIDSNAAFDRTTGQRLQGEAFREAQNACRATGATVEGNLKAREQAAQAAVGFLNKTFGR